MRDFDNGKEEETDWGRRTLFVKIRRHGASNKVAMGPVVTKHCPFSVFIPSCENLGTRSLEGVTGLTTGMDHVGKIQGLVRSAIIAKYGRMQPFESYLILSYQCKGLYVSIRK